MSPGYGSRPRQGQGQGRVSPGTAGSAAHDVARQGPDATLRRAPGAGQTYQRRHRAAEQPHSGNLDSAQPASQRAADVISHREEAVLPGGCRIASSASPPTALGSLKASVRTGSSPALSRRLRRTVPAARLRCGPVWRPATASRLVAHVMVGPDLPDGPYDRPGAQHQQTGQQADRLQIELSVSHPATLEQIRGVPRCALDDPVIRAGWAAVRRPRRWRRTGR